MIDKAQKTKILMENFNKYMNNVDSTPKSKKKIHEDKQDLQKQYTRLRNLLNPLSSLETAIQKNSKFKSEYNIAHGVFLTVSNIIELFVDNDINDKQIRDKIKYNCSQARKSYQTLIHTLFNKYDEGDVTELLIDNNVDLLRIGNELTMCTGKIGVLLSEKDFDKNK